ncbi:MAG: tetratricopeptide repeat protein [Zoogloeaceae bacterium]|jgi:predicted negative regulator of RcsB-dependent stress response|nr:tetratricopeptide repeat protein [Zoogloeaceae bacterium]
MATFDLEEQEQIAGLKTWWKMYGNLITTVIVAAAVATVGWNGWNWWQRNQAAKASMLFSGVQSGLAQQDVKRARELAGELIDKYSGTAYAGLAALLSAKAQADGGDVKSAQAQLAWAADNAKDSGVRDLARLRLATLLLDDNSYDEALQRLAAEPAAAFWPRFNELRGDVLVAQGKREEARAAYQAALEKLKGLLVDGSVEARARAGYQEILQAKLDVLGAGK